MEKRTKGYLAIILANVIFGFSFMASKIALQYTSPEVFLSIRFGTSFVILTVLLLVGVFKLNLKGKDIRPLIGLGLCQPVIYFACENYGIKNASTSFAGIMIGLIPIAGYMLSVWINHDPFSGKKFIMACGSVVGVVILSLSEQSSGSINMIGILCLVGAVIAGSLFNVLTRKHAEQFSVFERTYVMFLIGTIAFTALGFGTTRGTLIKQLAGCLTHMDFVIALLYLAAVSSVVAFFCLNYAANYLTAQQTTSLANLTTVISVVAGVFVLKESFSVWHGVGIVLILISIYMFNRTE